MANGLEEDGEQAIGKQRLRVSHINKRNNSVYQFCKWKRLCESQALYSSSAQARVNIRAPAHEDDRKRRFMFLSMFCEFDAIKITRHMNVGHEQLIAVPIEKSNGLIRVTGIIHLEAGVGQNLDHNVAYDLLVLNHQNAGLWQDAPPVLSTRRSCYKPVPGAVVDVFDNGLVSVCKGDHPTRPRPREHPSFLAYGRHTPACSILPLNINHAVTSVGCGD